jgi:hypothetical protein
MQVKALSVRSVGVRFYVTEIEIRHSRREPFRRLR